MRQDVKFDRTDLVLEHSFVSHSLNCNEHKDVDEEIHVHGISLQGFLSYGQAALRLYGINLLFCLRRRPSIMITADTGE
jgi:hypothetical protein